ncbi:receptor-type tyrosine-protein phosphatase H isoform X2 [Danio rerio]|uniref:Receptor-type tyrosine-protein phosphatase H isoform X2 n=1 Tax=Danio rerio TaxID=7955 RepID=A0AC58ITG4_DANRE
MDMARNIAQGQTIPPNVNDVRITHQTESELTFQWDIAGSNSGYNYILQRDGIDSEVITAGIGNQVTYTVSVLSSGTKYNFILFTVFEGLRSSGFPFYSATVPPNVESVSVIDQSENTITLQWKKDKAEYSYELKYEDKVETPPSPQSTVEHTVKSLSPGTKYTFTLYTVFEGLKSSGFSFSNVTVPPNVESVSVIAQSENEITLQWKKDKAEYFYELRYEDKVETPPSTQSTVEYLVKSLSPGTKYAFTLYTVFEGLKSSGFSFSAVTVPLDIIGFSVIGRNETALTLQWTKEKDEYTYELEKSDVETHISFTDTTVVCVITSLSPGTEYSYTLYTVFEGVKSHGHRFADVTVPSNVESVSVVEAIGTDVILQWNAVPNEQNNKYHYILKYSDVEETVDPTDENVITHHVSGLNPATNYSFTLHTEFYSQRSTGYNFYLSTSSSSITEVRVTRSLTELTVEWNKFNKSNVYNYTLLRSDGAEIDFTGSAVVGDVITHKYSSLKPGTVYSFTLFTVVDNVRDPGFRFKSITTLDCASFSWEATNTSIVADVYGCTYVTAQSSTGSGKNASIEGDRVNLRDLYPGESYTVSLFYNLESEMLTQCSQRLTLVPNSVSHLCCKYHSGGYGLAVMWEYPDGVVDVVEVDVNKKSFNHSHGSDEPTQQLVTGLQAAQWYKVTATSFSGARRSETISINCQTDPAGVIAGVLVFFLLVIIICAGVFVWIRYGSAKFHNKRSHPPVESKVSITHNKTIASDKFPEHFHNMSCDDKRNFSVEYKELGSVGVKQSSVTARLPENKDKNRISYVLPYDSSRVHLTVNKAGDSDYFNANYIPGYGNVSRQYIAAQGPLPSTVNDFWRMVWEQKSSAIVMVTNCTEDGMVKCEQYWPLDNTPCLYGNLLVAVKSENKSESWTLREFHVKNKMTSDTRIVHHFHFTAWPDHGVPCGTEDLIQFRELVRQHIESPFSAGPTVVHCSAGVGQTGTLIALDVLLQQLNREKAVGVAAFVKEMRLSRPLMVETESQYVFLHQCILDSLPPQSEPIYENTDSIYVNEMALKSI